MRAVLVALLFVSSVFGDVIFSRRIYQEHGASYQQIWTWNPSNGALKQLTHSLRDHGRPVCEGNIVKFTSPSPDAISDVKLWSFNPATGEERTIGPAPEPKERPAPGNCERFRDLEACGNEETLVVSRSGKQIGRFQIEADKCPGKCETPIRSLDWTEDGKWLLVGEEGLNDGSGQRQDDYYLVNLATMKLSTVASAYIAFWLPRRDQIVYVTPQGLAPLPDTQRKHNVWAQQLMFFDPLKGTPTAITSGLTNNVDPSWCEAAR
jgi:hypothetical protein